MRPNHDELIDSVLRKFIRPEDRFLYLDNEESTDTVIIFAERHGIFTDPIGDEQPDLIIAIVDPSGDDSLTALARSLATQQSADLIVAELPSFID